MLKKQTLIIVESPKKAKLIAKFLGSDYVVMASIGHVVDLVTDKTMGIDIENGFKPKYAVLPDKKEKIKAITDVATKSANVLLAPDPDREGEAIAKHLYEIIKKYSKNIKRITFHEITKKAVELAVKSPRDIDESLFDAQQARRVLDRIVGFTVSPYLINKYNSKLSAGRVQSVAVRMVVDREREIEAFKPEEYWTITAHLSNQKNESFIAKYDSKVTDEVTALKIKSELEKDTFVVHELTETEQKKSPNPPFITATLAAAAAGKYKFKTDKTMKCAQSLYEAGLITYVRTDSTRCSDESVDFCRDWLERNGYDIPKKPNRYSTGKDSQDAHEAIRPTDVETTADNIYQSDDEKKIYKLIWDRFVTSQMNPAIFDTVSVTVKSSSNHYLKAAGKCLKYKGWLELTDLTIEDDVLPVLKLKEALSLVEPGISAEQKFTKPPARYNEKTLVEELKKRGIGRPSTYATIMSKITDKNYVATKKGVYYPTDTGKEIVDDLVQYFNFLNYDYTAEMESKLDQIADGQLQYVKMLTDFYEPFKIQLTTAHKSKFKDFGIKCSRCNSPMLLKSGQYGPYMSCSNYPECKSSYSCEMVDGKPVPKGDKQFGEQLECPRCQAPMVLRNGKFGPFFSCTKYPTCNGIQKYLWDKKCQECNKDLYATIYYNEERLACLGWPNCKYYEAVPQGTFAKRVGRKNK